MLIARHIQDHGEEEIRAREEEFFIFNQHNKAAVKLQSFWRMKLQMFRFRKQKIASDFDAKYNLKRALADMETAVAQQKAKYAKEDAVVKI